MGPVSGRDYWFVGSLAAVLVATATMAGLRVSPNFAVANRYNAIFSGALIVSEKVPEHLQALGWPPTAAEQVGVNYFVLSRSQSKFLQAHPELVSRRKLLAMFLREPAIGWRLAGRTAAAVNSSQAALRFVLDTTGVQPAAGWTTWKARLAGGWTWLGFLAAALAAGATAWWRVRDPSRLSAAVVLWFAACAALAEMAAAVVGDGFSDFGRHLVGASVCIDLAMAALVWLGATLTGPRA
jgi:hypothetical protein